MVSRRTDRIASRFLLYLVARGICPTPLTISITVIDNNTVEIVCKEGFEKYITDDESNGGVVVWHIDDAINEKWFLKAQCVSSNKPDGKRHDLGNALLPREGFSKITDENGNFVKFGPMYADDSQKYIPFFYKSDDEATSSFDSNKYCGAASLSYSLNNFPEGVSDKFNLHIDVLDEAGAQMRIKITRTEK